MHGSAHEDSGDHAGVGVSWLVLARLGIARHRHGAMQDVTARSEILAQPDRAPGVVTPPNYLETPGTRLRASAILYA